MPTKFIPDNSAEYVDGLDRHYYQRQVGPASPFDNTHAFRLAAAHAKDRARHEMVRAVRQADRDQRAASFTGLGAAGITGSMSVSRSVNGVEGAPDDAIKL